MLLEQIDVTNPRQVAAAITLSGHRRYVIAPLVGCHPSVISTRLNSREPLDPEWGEKVIAALRQLGPRQVAR